VAASHQGWLLRWWRQEDDRRRPLLLRALFRLPSLGPQRRYAPDCDNDVGRRLRLRVKALDGRYSDSDARN
jgi:hypothetical protein